jgi:hypothetical protein
VAATAPPASTRPVVATMPGKAGPTFWGKKLMAVATACVSVFVFHDSDIHPDISYVKIYRDVFLKHPPAGGIDLKDVFYSYSGTAMDSAGFWPPKSNRRTG